MLKVIIWLGKFIGWLGGVLFICSCIFKLFSRLIIRLIGWIKKFDKDEILRKIFERPSQFRILVKEAKRKVGRLKYWWLVECFSPRSKGVKCKIVEIGEYLHKISEVERNIKATKEREELPSLQRMEKEKKESEEVFKDLLISLMKEIGK